jgi:hypothetical protein
MTFFLVFCVGQLFVGRRIAMDGDGFDADLDLNSQAPETEGSQGFACMVTASRVTQEPATLNPAGKMV